MSESFLCLLCGLFLPITMLVTGALMWRFPASYGGIGYHTSRAQSSPEAWAFAQWLSARLITLSHIPVLILSAVTVVIGTLMKLGEDAAAGVLIAMTVVQTAVLFVVIGVVEAKLSKRFDKNGKPK